jgi:hypothetical protein
MDTEEAAGCACKRLDRSLFRDATLTVVKVLGFKYVLTIHGQPKGLARL